jgi:hypothetical protein
MAVQIPQQGIDIVGFIQLSYDRMRVEITIWAFLQAPGYVNIER